MVEQDKREAAEMMEKAVNVTGEAAKKVESTLSALKEAQVRIPAPSPGSSPISYSALLPGKSWAPLWGRCICDWVATFVTKPQCVLLLQLSVR